MSPRAAFPLVALCLLAAPLPLAAQEALTVAIVTAEPQTVARQLSLTGEIVAHQSLNVSFPTGGRVADVMVDDGDRVSAGATLATIDRVQQEQALRAAEAGLATARANLQKAEDDDRRQDQLLERGATTRTDRNAAGDDYAEAQALEAQARAELDRAREALDDTLIAAPSDATVIRRMAEPGQVVGAAQPVLELALGPPFDARFEVPEVVLTNAKAAPVVRLSSLDSPGTVVTGEVRDISPLIDQSTGTVEVTVTLNDPLPGVSYGDAIRGTVDLPGEARIVLPWSAMSASAEGPAVWVLDAADTAHLRQVDVLRFETGKIVLTGGVEPGERVVSLGAQLLFEGRKVNPVEAE